MGHISFPTTVFETILSSLGCFSVSMLLYAIQPLLFMTVSNSGITRILAEGAEPWIFRALSFPIHYEEKIGFLCSVNFYFSILMYFFILKLDKYTEYKLKTW